MVSVSFDLGSSLFRAASSAVVVDTQLDNKVMKSNATFIIIVYFTTGLPRCKSNLSDNRLDLLLCIRSLPIKG